MEMKETLKVKEEEEEEGEEEKKWFQVLDLIHFFIASAFPSFSWTMNYESSPVMNNVDQVWKFEIGFDWIESDE